jgi:hypothetical protein
MAKAEVTMRGLVLTNVTVPVGQTLQDHLTAVLPETLAKAVNAMRRTEVSSSLFKVLRVQGNSTRAEIDLQIFGDDSITPMALAELVHQHLRSPPMADCAPLCSPVKLPDLTVKEETLRFCSQVYLSQTTRKNTQLFSSVEETMTMTFPTSTHPPTYFPPSLPLQTPTQHTTQHDTPRL